MIKSSSHRRLRMPLLSICIPNYNRAAFLSKNIDAIGRQANQDVEVVISDNASEDDVERVVNEFRNKYSQVRIIYHRNRTNIGFDRNVIKVVSLATGKYCWLLSNDDSILPGSIIKILALVRKPNKFAFILVNYRRFDNLLKRVTARQMINLNKDLLFDNVDSFYFKRTQSSYFKILGINVLTMSCDIFNRRFWLQSISRTKRFIGHNFIHVFTILDLIRQHPTILFIAQPQAEYVSNNHRTWANFIWRDYRKVLLGYLAEIGYHPGQLKDLRSNIKQDEFNERLLVLIERTGLYSKLFPYIRKIRQLLGHKI